MAERIPQSVAKVVVFRAYLASDGKTLATGKTIAITISKNGGAFGNIAAGATNATEITSGFYKFTLAAGDTDTVGPLAWRGAVAAIDDAGDVYSVIAPDSVNVATFTTGAITAAAIAADAITDAKVASDVTIASVTGAVGSVTGAVGSVTGAVGSVTGAVGSVTGAVGSVTGNVGGNVTGSVGSVVGAVGSIAAGGIANASFAADAITASKIHADVTTELQAGLATSSALATAQTSIDDIPTNAELATALGTADDAVLTVVNAIKVKTDSLTFTVANQVDANAESMNATAILGTGTALDLWRG